jgi:hypothetical protein
MKNTLAISISLLFLLFLIVGTSNDALTKFKEIRNKSNFLRPQKYTYGDLYGFSYLPEFRVSETKKTDSVEIVKNKENRTIHLYSFCDSYIYTFLKSITLFNSVTNYQHSKWDYDPDPANFKLDTTQFNVLLIERVERYIRMNFNDTNFACSKLNFKQAIEKRVEKPSIPVKINYVDMFFNPLIENSLEYCLFDYALFNPARELKAHINDYLFNRIDKDVVLSDNREYLFLKETVNNESTSSFSDVSEEEIDKIVASLNYINDKAHKTGFDKVYFSFMPNPASVIGYQNKKYNELIPRIQKNKKLKIEFIDAYSLLKMAKIQVYRNSDTHWNKNGFNMWMNIFNKELDSLASTTSYKH